MRGICDSEVEDLLEERLGGSSESVEKFETGHQNSNENSNSENICRSSRLTDPDQSISSKNKNKNKNQNQNDHQKLMSKWVISLLALYGLLYNIPGTRAEGNNNWERPGGMPKITNLEVMCGAAHMEVHLNFDSPFFGLVFSKGMYGHDGCIYVPPRTGKNSFVFNIYYDKCGTKPDNNGKFYENTVVVQYDEELIEAWDEAKRLRCEWFNDYEKTATKTSPMVISDLDVIELNFHGDNVDCWMEIQQGKGPWAPPLNGIVPLGTTLTMVVAVKDPKAEFDMRVKACEASDGHNGHILALTDPEGCVLRPKLMGRFAKVKLDDERASVLTYAFLNAFKFPDMLNVHIRCTVEICRHGCPDHCQPPPPVLAHPNEIHGEHSLLEPIAYESQNTQGSKVKPNDLNKGSLGLKSLPVTEATLKKIPQKPQKVASQSQGNGLESPIRLEPQPVGPGPTLYPHMRAPPPILKQPAAPQQQQQQQQQIPQHLLFQQQQQQQQGQRIRPQGPFSGGHPLTQHLLRLPTKNNNNNFVQPPPGQPQRPLIPLQNQQRFPQFNFQHRHPQPHESFRGHSGENQQQQQQQSEFHRQQQLYEEHLLNQNLQQNIQSQPRANSGEQPKFVQNPEISPAQQGQQPEDQAAEASSVKSVVESGPNNNDQVQGQDRKRETSEKDKNEEKSEEKAENGTKVEDKSSEERGLPQPQALKADNPDIKVVEVKMSQSSSSSEERLDFPKGPRKMRLRRSMADNNDVIGVQGAFKVVSEADLNFLLNGSSLAQPTMVLKGKMGENLTSRPIYGICLPRVGFGIAFFGLGVGTLVAILIAVFLAYAHFRVSQTLKKNSKANFEQHLSIQQQQPQQQQPFFPLVILRKMW